MENKHTPLSEKRITLDFEPFKLKVMKDWLYKEDDVKEAVQKIINFIENNDDGYVDKIREIFGSLAE